MSSTITLIYTDERGERRRAVVGRSPFFIGSAPGSDLHIPNPYVSLRHARIETYAGRPYISGCQSDRRTSLNGRRVTTATELRDGDSIGLGPTQTLSVRIDETGEGEPETRRAEDARRAPPPGPTVGEALLTLLRNPAIAGASLGLLFLGAVALILLLLGNRGGESADSANGARNGHANARPTGTARPTPSTAAIAQENTATSEVNRRAGENVSPSPAPADSPVDSDEQIGGLVRRVMSHIADDSAPYVSDDGIRDVARHVREYRGSASLAGRFRAMSNGRNAVVKVAEEINIKPPLLAYAALAASEGGGDPVATAQQMKNKLRTLNATFGVESANRALLLVAAYPYPFDPRLGTQTRVGHPLDAELRRRAGRGSKAAPAEAGTVWFLKKEGGIRPDAYQLVVRLLAIGVIARNPRGHGVDADPLPY